MNVNSLWRWQVGCSILLWGLGCAAVLGLGCAAVLADTPQLLLEPRGSISYITEVNFPDEKTLLVGGWDKVVRVWRRESTEDPFRFDAGTSFRVPRAGGLNGVINAMALSEDGRWLAVGGKSITADAAEIAAQRRLVPVQFASPAVLLDIGQIFVFDVQTGEVHILRGHLGPVVGLAFFPNVGNAPLLTSLGHEQRPDRDNDNWGTVRVWDVLKHQHETRHVAAQYVTDAALVRPQLAVIRDDNRLESATIHIQWGDGVQRHWSLDQKQIEASSLSQTRYNDTLAVRGAVGATGRVAPAAGRVLLIFGDSTVTDRGASPTASY
jgi:hypothetical protein